MPLSSAHDPLLLSGMSTAVDRLERAFRLGEKVAVFGDYDVDGVTSTVLLAKLFTLLKLPHELYIPDRLQEGYGPNTPALLGLQARGAKVVVTVDCGTSAVAEAQACRDAGLDLIITDHHLPGPQVPSALAVVNPKTSPLYPYDMLGGVGVAYKLAQALLARLQHPRATDFLDHMLELVALGTICDVAPLDGENRALVREGLARLRQGRWMGLRSLAQAASIKLPDIDAGAVGFHLGPRINAGGRIGDAMLGVRLMLSKDADECRALAAQLNAENRERQDIEKRVIEAASLKAQAAVEAGAKALVLWPAPGEEPWHPGVVGLAASRLQERFQRPAFVFGLMDGVGKGSGRSRPPFNLVQALQACSSHLQKFGGHEVAAGATILEQDLPAFAQAFLAQAAGLSDEDRRPVIQVDFELGFDEITPGLLEQLAAFEPHGMRNARPLFVARGLSLGPRCRAIGKDGTHLKLELSQKGQVLEGIAFGQAARLPSLQAAGKADAVFSPAWNEWNNTRSLQLEVKDLRPSGEED